MYVCVCTCTCVYLWTCIKEGSFGVYKGEPRWRQLLLWLFFNKPTVINGRSMRDGVVSQIKEVLFKMSNITSIYK